MPETTTRGWAPELVEQIRRIRTRCQDDSRATVDDVEFLSLAAENLAGEIGRLHSVIRDYQVRVGEAGGSRG